MRVVLLVTDLERGGTPLRLARLAQHLHALGDEPIVGCLAAAGPVSESLAHAGIRTFACDARDARDWRALVRLYHTLAALRPDLVHATLTHANVAARLVARLIGIPVVTSTATIERSRRWHLAAERLTARLDRGHLVNGQALAEHVVRRFRVPRERVFVVSPSIGPLGPHLDPREARARYQIAPEAFVVGWVGRFDPVKRLDLLLAAAAALRPEGFVFLLAGDGPERPAIERRIADLGLGEVVKLAGWQPYVGPVLSAADLFAFPSDTEGMPNAVLQAFAAGTPVVAADTPALRELAANGTRIALTPAGDAAALAAELRRLRGAAEERARLAAAGRAFAESTLDARRSAEETRAVYTRVLGR